ncbi:445_t:CDS:2 [Gigaspora margarita]|uniref:445_t:CDS:1 n=1 Tax=Gigaspora margarita TaxID=4874 RepID=A0ABM8W672_GIGMA|nr:445_t:CDS:2 [Gigaspora margarita]
MSTIFISFCFIKTVSGTDNFINKTALFRVAINNDQLSELTFKGYTGNPDSLVIPFEKNTIILMVGRYMYEDKEHLSLVQATPVLSPDPNYIPTSNDLLLSLPLLIYSAMPVSGSYFSDSNSGRKSFMLARRLYNGITGTKNISSKVIVSYRNENKCYNATYFSEGQSPSACDKSNSHSCEDLDLHLDSIEKKYAFLNSTLFQKKQPTPLHSLFTKKSTKDNVSPINLMDILSQIQNKTASTTSTPPNVNSVSLSSNTHHTPQTATNNNKSFLPEMEDNTAPDLDTEFITPIYEDPTPEPPAKCKKHTLPSRKNNIFPSSI